MLLYPARRDVKEKLSKHEWVAAFVGARSGKQIARVEQRGLLARGGNVCVHIAEVRHVTSIHTPMTA